MSTSEEFRLKFILCGASGSGKTTMSRFLETDLGMIRCITTTTRPPRVGEIDGKDYRFTNRINPGKMFEHSTFGSYEYGTTWDDLRNSDFIILEPKGVAHFRQHYPDPLCVIQLQRTGIQVDPERRARDIRAGYDQIHPDFLITGETIDEMRQNLMVAVEFYLNKDRFLEMIGRAGWSEFCNRSTRLHPNSICLENKEYPYTLYFTDFSMAEDFARTIAFSARIHDFLAAYDPAFGYAQGVPGQRNEAEMIESIRKRLFGEPCAPNIYTLDAETLKNLPSLLDTDVVLNDQSAQNQLELIMREANTLVIHECLRDKIKSAEQTDHHLPKSSNTRIYARTE